MKNVISKLNENKDGIVIMGLTGDYIRTTIEIGSNTEIIGDDLIIGDDEDHCVRLKNYSDWGVIDTGCDFILHSPDGNQEVFLCVS